METLESVAIFVLLVVSISHTLQIWKLQAELKKLKEKP